MQGCDEIIMVSCATTHFQWGQISSWSFEEEIDN